MRASPVLIAALAACSDSSGPRHLPVLTTQLSAPSAAINGGVVVTLNVSNPTDTTERLAYWTQSTTAEFKQDLQANWQGGYSGGFTGQETFVITPGQLTILGEVAVGFGISTANANFAPDITPTREFISLAPGSYTVRACVMVPPNSALSCANGVPFTLTQ